MVAPWAQVASNASMQPSYAKRCSNVLSANSDKDGSKGDNGHCCQRHSDTSWHWQQHTDNQIAILTSITTITAVIARPLAVSTPNRCLQQHAAWQYDPKQEPTASTTTSHQRVSKTRAFSRRTGRSATNNSKMARAAPPTATSTKPKPTSLASRASTCCMQWRSSDVCSPTCNAQQELSKSNTRA